MIKINKRPLKEILEEEKKSSFYRTYRSLLYGFLVSFGITFTLSLIYGGYSVLYYCFTNLDLNYIIVNSFNIVIYNFSRVFMSDSSIYHTGCSLFLTLVTFYTLSIYITKSYYYNKKPYISIIMFVVFYILYGYSVYQYISINDANFYSKDNIFVGIFMTYIILLLLFDILYMITVFPLLNKICPD